MVRDTPEKTPPPAGLARLAGPLEDADGARDAGWIRFLRALGPLCVSAFRACPPLPEEHLHCSLRPTLRPSALRPFPPRGVAPFELPPVLECYLLAHIELLRLCLRAQRSFLAWPPSIRIPRPPPSPLSHWNPNPPSPSPTTPATPPLNPLRCRLLPQTGSRHFVWLPAYIIPLHPVLEHSPQSTNIPHSSVLLRASRCLSWPRGPLQKAFALPEIEKGKLCPLFHCYNCRQDLLPALTSQKFKTCRHSASHRLEHASKELQQYE
ncbi:hypothetical protein BDZ91DRAFT_407873 [Kalaharituber pfeilii]|nr:hypothetical protein BDZ91DRAFT_407873 [Kalaharituber pfeilii]